MNDFFFSSWATSREKACDYIKIGNRFEANILEFQENISSAYKICFIV